MERKQIEAEFGSVMIIVPHQDDEILMTAGVIYEAVKKQVPVHVVMVTNGDYGSRDFRTGRARLKETLEGTKLLGLEERNVFFLGYADTGMPAEESFLTHLYEETDEKKIYPSSCSKETYGTEEKEEFHMMQHNSHAPYCRSSLKEDLKEVIGKVKPQNIITTSEYDMHGDHAALYRFLAEILRECREENGYEPDLYAGIVHSNAGDENWPKKDTGTFDCPGDFENATTLKWDSRIVIEVPDCMKVKQKEQNVKLQALLKYQTALEPNAYDYLMSFVKDEEIFWKMEY